MVSGYPRGAEIAAEEGVPFFAKPIDLAQFRAAVDAALGERRAAQRPADLSPVAFLQRERSRAQTLHTRNAV